MNYKLQAEALIKWNDKNLLASADLKKEDLANYFADNFEVKANGRYHQANHDNYYEFLNQFRSNIKRLHHEFHEQIENANTVVNVMTTTVTKIDDTQQIFEVMLLLKFNEQGKVILWYEIYTYNTSKVAS